MVVGALCEVPLTILLVALLLSSSKVSSSLLPGSKYSKYRENNMYRMYSVRSYSSSTVIVFCIVIVLHVQMIGGNVHVSHYTIIIHVHVHVMYVPSACFKASYMSYMSHVVAVLPAS